MSKALFSSVDRRWHEIDDSIAAASDMSLVADIIETEPPSADDAVEIIASLQDVGGKPVRVYTTRARSAVEKRRYLRPLAFYDRLPAEVLLGLCRAAQADPQILLMLLRLSAALYIESDDAALNAALDALIQAGFPIDKAKLFADWDKRPPVAADATTGLVDEVRQA